MSSGYKFQRIRKQLMDLIENSVWEVGDNFYSETQLSLKFHVSRQTIRKSMQSLVDEGYLVRRQGSGTYITEKAIAKRNTKTNVVGILVTYLSDYIFPIIINELEQEFTQAGFTVQIASSGNSSKLEGELLQKMLQNKVDGIILEPTRSALPNPNTPVYKELINKKFPMVTIHSSYTDVNIPTVAVNDHRSGYLAAEYLLKLGHRKIGAILKSDDLQGHRRYQGILEAHRHQNVSYDDQKVYWYTTEDLRTIEDEHSPIMDRLEACTAVICYNDQIGIIYENILIENGFNIPQDISIVSIDNSKYAALAPVPLTSVNSPIRSIGQEAAKKLLRQIHGENLDNNIIFEPKLVIRDSAKEHRGF